MPISRRYMRTGSLTFSPTPAGSSRSRSLLALFELFFEILGLFEDLDAGAVESGQHVFEFGAAGQVAGQNFADLVVKT